MENHYKNRIPTWKFNKSQSFWCLPLANQICLDWKHNGIYKKSFQLALKKWETIMVLFSLIKIIPTLKKSHIEIVKIWTDLDHYFVFIIMTSQRSLTIFNLWWWLNEKNWQFSHCDNDYKKLSFSKAWAKICNDNNLLYIIL